jgi:hypothetical protein
MRVDASCDPSLNDHPIMRRYNAFMRDAQEANRAIRLAPGDETASLLKRMKLAKLLADNVITQSIRMMRADPSDLHAC